MMNKPLTQTIGVQRHQGVALITVLLIVALAAVMATEMTARLQIQLARSTNIQFNQQAYWYAMGAESFAKRVLIADNQADQEVTHLNQQWAQGYNSFPVPQGEIAGGLTDMHSCLNLNALKDDEASSSNPSTQELPAREAFERLVVKLEVEGVGEFEAEYLGDALTDWLDSDDAIASSGGAEDNDYAAKEFPYFAANSLLARVSELRAIEHFTPAIIEALTPYVCVIPGVDSHQININTMTADNIVLLEALLDISNSEAQSLIDARGESGFENINELYGLAEFTKLKISDEQKQQFVVDSEYFTLQANSQFNNSYFNLISVMQVIDNSKVNVISRTIGRK